MTVHQRKTHQSGADRMLFDNCWYSSRPLNKIKVGDILRVKNVDTLDVVDWEVTELPLKLTPDEAKAEWFKYPFGSEQHAKKCGYFPYVVKNLKNKTPPSAIVGKTERDLGAEAENKHFTAFCDKSNIVYLHIDQSQEAYASKIFEDESKRPDFIISIPNTGSVFVDVKARKKYPFYPKTFGNSFSAFTIDIPDYQKLANLQEKTSTPVWYAVFERRGNKVMKNTAYLIPLSRISKFKLAFHKSPDWDYIAVPDKCFYNWKDELEIKDGCTRCDDKICETLKLKEESGELRVGSGRK